MKRNVQLIHDLPLTNIKVNTVFQLIWLYTSNTAYRHSIPLTFLSGLGFLRDRGKSQFLSVVSKTLSIVQRSAYCETESIINCHVGISLWVKVGKMTTETRDIILIA